MMNASSSKGKSKYAWIPPAVGFVILFVYSSVLWTLARQWWSDENYSHGLLVPFVIALIIWQDKARLSKQIENGRIGLGIAIVLLGLMLLFAGTLGAELFTQRISLIFVIAGTIVYFFGSRILSFLSVPFLLLLLSIPIPQIILNKIAFPLQLLATRSAEQGLTILGIASTRKGNVIDLIPIGYSAPVSLEVVEACSGIRSLITLITLGVILAYFTRNLDNDRGPRFYRNYDFLRGVLLVALAIPIALVTNASRVLITGIATYFYGQSVLDNWWHDAFGWIAFISALALLLFANSLARKFLVSVRERSSRELSYAPLSSTGTTYARASVLMALLLTGGLLINWLQMRAETPVERVPLVEFPTKLGEAFRPTADKRFSPATEEVLRASDYVMRDYIDPPRRFNLYIGYYATQRTGATYHSPQNCLPGSGWVMSNGGEVEFDSPKGRRILANRYVVQNGKTRQVMIYWYQGRGRTTASEYWDKLYTVIDSVTVGRTDGSMVRIMTPIYEGENDEIAFTAAKELSRHVADSLGAFVPD